MLKTNAKQLLAVLLSVLLVRPYPLMAASPATASRSVLGSITSYGPVRVGDTIIPPTGTLFSGDRVQTEAGSAIVQYQQGARVLLGTESLANFSSSQVQLQKGRMSFQTVSADSPAFAASTLRLEPAAAKSAANVTLQDKRASVWVTEGSLNVVDPSGVKLASLNAGEARLFMEASAALPASAAGPAAAAPAAPPQLGGPGGSRVWVIGVVAGVAGAALGIAGLVKAGDAQDDVDKSQAQITQIQSQNAALQEQAKALQAELAALSAAAAKQTTLLQQLSAAQAKVSQVQSELNAVQAEVNQLASISAQGIQLSSTQKARLQQLLQDQNLASNRLNEATKQLNAALVGLGVQPLPVSP